MAAVSEEDALRARFYALLSRVLAAPPDTETMELLRGLSDSAPDTPVGKALRDVGELAQRTTEVAAEQEFTELFYGQGAGGELSPYASIYITGFVYDAPLSKLRQALSGLGVARQDEWKEPEDHIAFEMELMHGLITGSWGQAADLETQRAVFNDHIAPWAVRFFEDLESAEKAALYMPIGTLGKLFIEIEAGAFEISADA